MKSTMFLVLTAMFISQVAASGKIIANDRFTPEKLEVIEKSLKIALESPIAGIQASAAQTVRDLKARVPDCELSTLVIPLMRIVKDRNAECGPRILAALALHELNSEMGDFAIARTGQFTEDRRLKHVCTWLTHDRLLAQGKVEPARKFTKQ